MPDEIKEKEQAPQVLTESENKGRENRRRKRIRQRASSSQTEDELPNEEHVQGVRTRERRGVIFNSVQLRCQPINNLSKFLSRTIGLVVKIKRSQGSRE